MRQLLGVELVPEHAFRLLGNITAPVDHDARATAGNFLKVSLFTGLLKMKEISLSLHRKKCL